MSAWWENVKVWFLGLAPEARIAAVLGGILLVVALAVLVLRPRNARKAAESRALAAPQTRPAARRIEPAAALSGDSRRPAAAEPRRVAPQAPKESGQYVDLSPRERVLVDQAVSDFRRKAEKTRDAALTAAVAKAEEGRGADLLAWAEGEHQRAVGVQARADAAWRLGGLLWPENKSRALALYREAAELAPHLATAWLALALALRAGDPVRSAEALERAAAAARDPKTKAAILAERADQARAADEAAVAAAAAEESAALWRPYTLEAGSSGEAAQGALAAVLGTLGEAARDLGERARARKAFAEAADLATYLATRRPADSERAWAAGEAADRLADLDETDEALGAAIAEISAAGAGDREARREAAVTAIKIGDSLRLRGKLTEARSHYAEALEIFDSMGRADPSSATARRDRAVALERLGDALLGLEDLGGARLRYDVNLRIREARAASAPGDPEARRDLALALIKMGDLGRMQQEPGAESRYARALDLARGLAAADPQDLAATHLLVLALDRAASAAQPAEARARYAEILSLLRPLAEQGRLSAEQQATLAAVEAHLEASGGLVRARA